MKGALFKGACGNALSRLEKGSLFCALFLGINNPKGDMYEEQKGRYHKNG